MFYQRSILTKLEKELSQKEIMVITGMRQVGKTTILQHLYDSLSSDNKAILDAGNPLHRKIFEEINYDNILHNLRSFGIKSPKKAYVFIDEIQNMPEISLVVKYLYDHYKIKFVLTGSSSYYLKNLFPESLSGRKMLFEIHPLTFREFLHFKHIHKDHYQTFPEKEKQRDKIASEVYKTYWIEYMNHGGFPGVVLEPNFERKKILLENIFTSYFEIDVKSLADFKDLSNLRDIMLLLIPRIGSKLDITKLSSELGVSRQTIYTYLTFLEQTYFISMIPMYSKSKDRVAAGNKKVYYCDSGLAKALGILSEGQLFENAVFQNLKSDYNNISYFSTKSGAEIDFIVENKYAFEVKMSPDARIASKIQKRAENMHLLNGYVISQKYIDEKCIILAHDL